MLYFHHIGCLVEDIDKAKKEYAKFANVTPSKTISIESQGVSVSFCGEIELIQPHSNMSLHKLIKKNINFYHVAYVSDDFDDDIERLKKDNYMIVADSFKSEAFKFKRCQFLRNNLFHLLEIIES